MMRLDEDAAVVVTLATTAEVELGLRPPLALSLLRSKISVIFANFRQKIGVFLKKTML
jgi:hypothetical protein